MAELAYEYAGLGEVDVDLFYHEPRAGELSLSHYQAEVLVLLNSPPKDSLLSRYGFLGRTTFFDMSLLEERKGISGHNHNDIKIQTAPGINVIDFQ